MPGAGEQRRRRQTRPSPPPRSRLDSSDHPCSTVSLHGVRRHPLRDARLQLHHRHSHSLGLRFRDRRPLSSLGRRADAPARSIGDGKVPRMLLLPPGVAPSSVTRLSLDVDRPPRRPAARARDLPAPRCAGAGDDLRASAASSSRSAHDERHLMLLRGRARERHRRARRLLRGVVAVERSPRLRHLALACADGLGMIAVSGSSRVWCWSRRVRTHGLR